MGYYLTYAGTITSRPVATPLQREAVARFIADMAYLAPRGERCAPAVLAFVDPGDCVKAGPEVVGDQLAAFGSFAAGLGLRCRCDVEWSGEQGGDVGRFRLRGARVQHARTTIAFVYSDSEGSDDDAPSGAHS